MRKNNVSLNVFMPAAGLACALLLSSMTRPAAAASLEAWAVDALAHVLHRDEPPENPETAARIAMARGEAEAAQIAFRSGSAVEVSASVGVFRSESGKKLEKVSAVFLNYQSVHKFDWGAVQSELILPHSQFPLAAPDAFRPEPVVALAPGKTRALWIIAETDIKTPAGVYQGSVALLSGGDRIEIPVEVKVYDSVVPAKRSLKIYNWMFWDKGAIPPGIPVRRVGGWGSLRNYLGSPEWDREDWSFVEKVARNMTAHRQNMFTVPMFYNVLCGPSVHSVKTIRRDLKHNYWAAAATLDAIAKKRGANLLAGPDALTVAETDRCADVLRGMARDRRFSGDKALVEALRSFVSDLEQLKKDSARVLIPAQAFEIQGVIAAIIEEDRNAVDKHEYEFDFSIFDRVSDIFLKHDPDGIIVGGFLCLFNNYGGEIEPGSGERHLLSAPVPVFDRAGEQMYIMSPFNSGDPRYVSFLGKFLPALVSHLKRKRRLDNFIIGMCDETFANVGRARVMLAEEVRKIAPEIKFHDAIRDTTRSAGSLDMWFPLPSHLECYIDFFRQRHAAGDEICYYTCVTPRGYNMNRFTDFPLIKSRLLHWHNFRFGTTGFLHWGYNAHLPPAGDMEYEGSGDPNLVYRDKDWNIVPSVRQAAQRDGIEDYELLKALAEKDGAMADKICAAIVTDCREYTRDPARFREVRELLLAAACPGEIDSELREKIESLELGHFTLLKDMPKGAPLDDAGWELVYQCDVFKPEHIGSDWIVTTGNWRVENGALAFRRTESGDGQIFFVKGAGRDQKMEFTAWSDSPYPNDLSALLCAELKKEKKTVAGKEMEAWAGNYAGAYFFGFGSEGNAFSKFMVAGIELRVMPHTIVPGKKHRIVARREGKRVTFVIDGETALDAESRDSIDGPGNVFPGFYLHRDGNIADVKIYTKK